MRHLRAFGAASLLIEAAMRPLALIALFLLPWQVPAQAQIQGGAGGDSLFIGELITGSCTNNYNLFNNGGVLGCQANGGGGGLTIGTTTITSGTNGRVLYDNSGVLGELAVTGSGSAVLATSPTMSGVTVTGSFTATGLVTNADLANAATTVNGQTCTLGSTCTVAAAAGTLTGTTLASNVVTSSLTSLAAYTAPSAAIGGCTIGSDILCITGTATFSNNVNGPQTFNISNASAGASNQTRYIITNDVGHLAQFVLTGSNAAFGAPYSADGVLHSTNGTGGILFLTTDSGSGATIRFSSQASGTNQMTIGALGATIGGTLTVSGIASDATHTTATVCEDTTTHLFLSGSGTLGVCLGTSGKQFKTSFQPMKAGIDDIMRINLQSYRYLPGYGDGGLRLQYGPTAQDVEAVLPDIVGHNSSGETINYDYGALFMISIRALQQIKIENDELRNDIKRLAEAEAKLPKEN
jgi:hypothetical protein